MATSRIGRVLIVTLAVAAAGGAAVLFIPAVQWQIFGYAAPATSAITPLTTMLKKWVHRWWQVP